MDSYRVHTGSNPGALRFGFGLETTKKCFDDDLWNSPYVKPGPEKAGLWYTRIFTIFLAVPFWRGSVTWFRPAPQSVMEHHKRIELLSNERRRNSYSRT